MLIIMSFTNICCYLFYTTVCFTIKINQILAIDCNHMVSTSFGSVRGCKESVNTDSLGKEGQHIPIYSFKGIPYAEPPIGELRFQKTVAKHYSEKTVLDATHYRNPCIQPAPIDLPFPSGLPSEDCLFLNIWTPTTNSRANLHVMFWIHGGAYQIGSGSEIIYLFYKSINGIYNGNQLALRDVVVVTINYRLGVFGNLYGNSSEAPGNACYWDQAMALNWTRQYISAFGGNPNEITLFGESAGSMSVSTHIVSNVTRNWFQRAIMQSGSAYNKVFSRDAKYAYEMARSFGSNFSLWTTGSCNDTNTWIQCLKDKSAVEILLAQTKLILWKSDSRLIIDILSSFMPIFGDFHSFIPISVNKAVKTGNFRNDIKILIGHNEMEGAFFSFIVELLSFNVLKGRYNPILPLPIVPIINSKAIYNDIKNVFITNQTVGEIIAEKYTKEFTNSLRLIFNPNPIRRSAAHAFGDYLITCPTVLFAGHFTRTSGMSANIFQYRLTYSSKQSISRTSIWTNVTHIDELPLVFGQPFQSYENMSWSNDDRKLSKQMMNIWTHFAKHNSVPNVSGNVWPAYSVKPDGSVNATYLELHPDIGRLGKLYSDRYRGKDGYSPSVINDCFNFMDQILSAMF